MGEANFTAQKLLGIGDGYSSVVPQFENDSQASSFFLECLTRKLRQLRRHAFHESEQGTAALALSSGASGGQGQILSILQPYPVKRTKYGGDLTLIFREAVE